MRVLVVASAVPSLEGSAAGRLGAGLALGLLEHGLDVSVLAADLHARGGPEPVDGVDVEVVGVVPEVGPAATALRLVRPWPWYASGAFAARVRERAAGADVIHLEEVYAGRIAHHLGRPALVHVHNDTLLDRGGWRAMARAGDRVGIEFARAEGRVRRRAPMLVASSAEVAAALRSRGRRDVGVLPAALAPGPYAVPARLEATVVGLIGSAGWPPTRDAVARLLVEVWPRVRARRPDAELRLAGHGMVAGAFPGLPEPGGVRWLGEVPSAAKFLQELGVLLYPVGQGSGVKVKVLEALASGLPVVTTPQGAEGIAGPSAGLLVARDPEELAGAAATLLGDQEARRRAGAAARTTVAAHHLPRAATAELPDRYRALVAGRVARAWRP